MLRDRKSCSIAHSEDMSRGQIDHELASGRPTTSLCGPLWEEMVGVGGISVQ